MPAVRSFLPANLHIAGESSRAGGSGGSRGGGGGNAIALSTDSFDALAAGEASISSETAREMARELQRDIRETAYDLHEQHVGDRALCVCMRAWCLL